MMNKNQTHTNIRVLLFILLSAGAHLAVLIPINNVIGLHGRAELALQKNISLNINRLKTQNPAQTNIQEKPTRQSPRQNPNQTSKTSKLDTLKLKPKQTKRVKAQEKAANSKIKKAKPLTLTKRKKPSFKVGMSQSVNKELSPYQKQLLAHLQKYLRPPANKVDSSEVGQVRLEIRIEYSQIATQVSVISSSNEGLNDWAIKSVYRANPLPAIPQGESEPYIFRPTLRVK